MNHALAALLAAAACAAATHSASAEPQAACPAAPERLGGTYTETRVQDFGATKRTYQNTVTLTWIKDRQDPLPPLPNSRQVDGMPGSRAWTEFHAGASPSCPVQPYRIEGGEIHFKLDGKSGAIGGPGGCEGKADATFNADALKDLSTLYIGEQGYLLTLGAPDYAMPQTTIKGTCIVPGGRTHALDSPVNDNAIVLLDQRGPFTGEVAGEINPPMALPGGWTHSAKWRFAGPSPAN